MPAPKVAAVEYHHAAFDHYFITAIADEIVKLDNGTFAGWTRTGASFNVYAADQVGTKPVCRFFSTAFAPKSSHFYTPDAAECATVKQNANWQFEGLVFNIAVPDANGGCSCRNPTQHRLYNNGMGAAPVTATPRAWARADMLAEGLDPRRLRARCRGDVRAALALRRMCRAVATTAG